MKLNIKYFLKVVSVNALLLCVGAIIVELMFGAWIKAPGLWTLSIQRDVSIRSWEHEKYLRDRPMLYSRDYYGFRGNSHSIAEVNIVAMGGSTTDEPNVSDEETWTLRLEQCLADRDVPAKIANAGINEQSSLGHIKNFEVWLQNIPNFRPRYLLAYMGINEPKIEGGPEDSDFNDNVVFRDQEGQPNRRYGLGTSVRYSTGKVLRDWITTNSAFYSIYRIVWGNIQAIRLGSNPRWNTELFHNSPKRGVFWRAEQSTFTETEQGLLKLRLAEQAMRSMDKVEQRGMTGNMRIDQLFKANIDTLELDGELAQQSIERYTNINQTNLKRYANRLKTLSNVSKNFGATPIFITQATAGYRIEGKVLLGSLSSYSKMASYNRVLMSVCEEEDIQCIDLGSKLEFKDSDFWDEEHTTPQGSSRIAAFLCDQLISGDLLQNLSGPTRFKN